MDTIAAISTALAPGGIGIVRISGDRALEIADIFFKSIDGMLLSNLKGYTAKFGKVFDGDILIDQAIALVFKSPHSYTGENVVEISCHGGVYIVKKVLNLAIKCGARLAEPGEFTKRAFLNGKIDLSEAESVMNLISAQGEKAERIAVSGLEGNINKKVDNIKNMLVDIMAGLSAWADYPDEDIPQIDKHVLKNDLEQLKAELIKMKDTYKATRAVTDGLKIAVVGRPNVGKSSLLNLLMGYQKVIVTDIAGTTRDIVEGNIMLGDIPVTLFDTAGIRETENIVEKLGVEKSKECLKDSDIIWLLFDGSKKLSVEDKEIIKLVDKSKTIAVINKSDLGTRIEINEINKIFNKNILISVEKEDGIEKLTKAVYNIVEMENLNSGEVFISGQRQFDIILRAISLLEEAISAIINEVTLDAVTVLIQNILNVLAELKGENVSEDIINKVFSKFCLVK